MKTKILYIVGDDELTLSHCPLGINIEVDREGSFTVFTKDIPDLIRALEKLAEEKCIDLLEKTTK